MKKKILLLCFGCLIMGSIFSQSLFVYGTNEVGRDEFLRAFNKNNTNVSDRAQSLREYLELYAKFKLKVKAAKELKLDTMAEQKYDMLNFRSRLESEYVIDTIVALEKTKFKKNPAVNKALLFQYADSVTLVAENRKYSIAKIVLFSFAGMSVKVNEWYNYIKEYKLNWQVYKGESYDELLERFIAKTVTEYYRKHLEDYDPEFKYQLQEFKEGNLMFEMMGRKVWNKSKDDEAALKAFYEANKDHFLWGESADVILINAKSYAYADYASENMKTGQYWKKITDNSEGMIQGDSGRYEISQLPVKPGTKLVAGAITAVLKSNTDNGASFVKLIKLYPANLQRNFDEAKSLVINEYQKQLEENWMGELAKKYPVKINKAVFDSLLK